MTAFAPVLDAVRPFLDPLALGIVLGGTLLVLVLRTPGRDLGRALRALATVLRRPWRAEPVLEQITTLSRIAARHGPLALDRNVIRDPDVAAAVAAIVDGEPPEVVRALVENANLARTERHDAAADVWAAMAEVAPAMGMIGTLIGLVRMFVSMTDPSAIGSAMAVALLTTLYGAVLASLVAMPVVARLRRLARIEASERDRLATPLADFAARERPRPRAAVAA